MGVGRGQVEPSFGRVGFGRDELFEQWNGLTVIAALRIRHREREIHVCGECGGRRSCESLPQVVDGRIVALLGGENLGEIVISKREFWIAGNGGLEFASSIIELALLLQKSSKSVVSGERVRLLRKGFAQMVFGRRGLALADQSESQVVMSFPRPGIKSQTGFECGHRAGNIVSGGVK